MMATVDLALGETVTGASGFLQLALLAIGIVVGAELVGNPHTGPVAGAGAGADSSWARIAPLHDARASFTDDHAKKRPARQAASSPKSVAPSD